MEIKKNKIPVFIEELNPKIKELPFTNTTLTWIVEEIKRELIAFATDEAPALLDWKECQLFAAMTEQELFTTLYYGKEQVGEIYYILAKDPDSCSLQISHLTRLTFVPGILEVNE